LRRVILALATRTASVLVVFCLGRGGCGAFFNFPPIGIIGNTGVGTFEARSTGCVIMGPVTGLSLGILDNAIRPNSFENPRRTPRKIPRKNPPT
jgi:hypothetical protein